MLQFITPILKLTERCNFTCSFCRYSCRSAGTDTMSFAMANKVLAEAAEFNMQHGIDAVHVVLHGGEPLLAGVDFFEGIVEIEEGISAAYPAIRFTNTVQTNGYLLNEVWVDFFQRHGFHVGVSIDGPSYLNSHCLLGSSKIPSEQKVLKGLHALQRAGVQVGVLSVITDRHLSYAQDMYNFFADEGIHDVGLCFCFGDAEEDCCSPSRLGAFLVELFDLYYYGTYRLRIREFDSLIERFYGLFRPTCTASCRELCGNYPMVKPDGTVYFCDPLMQDDDYLIGDIANSGLIDMLDGDRYRLLRRSALKGVENCAACELRPFCGGGCFRHDVCGRNGRASYFCEAYRLLTLHIQAVVSSHESHKDEE